MKTISEKIDNITHLGDAYLREDLPAPPSVKIELSRTCNFSCSFCANKTLKNSKGMMDKGFYKRIVKELSESGVKELGVFFYGESFLCSWLPEAISYAKSVGIEYVFLTTNGSISYPEKVKECMEAGLNSLKFSLNYMDEKNFTEVTGANVKWYYKSLENIKNAKMVRDEGNYKCGLFASYIQFDGEQCEKMQIIIDDMTPFVDEIYSLPLYNQPSTTKEGKEKLSFTPGNRGRYENMVDPLPCWALFKEGHITYDGMLYGCSFVVDDEFIMGDLNTEKFMDVWNSEKFKFYRKQHLNKTVINTACEKCILKC
jgi:radical SAM protein with 4Fe4S-binding SPASM domain